MCYKTRTHTYLQHLTSLARRAHRWSMVRPIGMVIGRLGIKQPESDEVSAVVHHAGKAY
jgi:hypothetical protein